MSLALLFSPQGSQTVGMGRELAAGSPAARAIYAAADAALGWGVSTLCWEGPAERLNDTRQTQPCLLTTSLACGAALEEAVGEPLRPTFVAGHSVGEYTAVVAAGVLELRDALQMVALRGRLMAAEAGSDGMAAVIGLDREAVQAAVEAVAGPTELVVANDNAPGQVVISGSLAAIERARRLLRARGAKRVIRLNVSGAFHSPHMAPVAEALAEAFSGLEWRDAEPPLMSNVTAEPVVDGGRIRNLLAEQVRSPVEWVASMRRLVDEGVDTFVECGPGRALAGMLKRIAPDARTLVVNDAATLASAVKRLSRRPAEAHA
ncbi:MAG: ACP S-malonyltransferase [Chloroflexota bacterium]|nr:ACP S-malonyltransferase [Chloroflexota bacterium]